MSSTKVHRTILEQFLDLGEYGMFPAVNAGRIVNSHLEKAAEAEAEGNTALAAEHLEFATFIDERR